MLRLASALVFSRYLSDNSTTRMRGRATFMTKTETPLPAPPPAGYPELSLLPLIESEGFHDAWDRCIDYDRQRWIGRMDGLGVLRFRFRDRSTFGYSARRAFWVLLYGREIPPGWKVSHGCNHWRCMDPACVFITPPGYFNKLKRYREAGTLLQWVRDGIMQVDAMPKYDRNAPVDHTEQPVLEDPPTYVVPCTICEDVEIEVTQEEIDQIIEAVAPPQESWESDGTPTQVPAEFDPVWICADCNTKVLDYPGDRWVPGPRYLRQTVECDEPFLIWQGRKWWEVRDGVGFWATDVTVVPLSRLDELDRWRGKVVYRSPV